MSILIMWTHFWHLLWRSLVYFPSELSGNWLSIVFLPITLYVIIEGIRYGWRPMVKKAFGRDARILVGMYVLLFCWAVIHTIYQDHINLARQNVILRQQLEFRQTNGVSLKLQSAVVRWSDVGLQIQANLLASNDGKPTTLRNWSAQIKSRWGIMEGDDDYGIPRLKGSPVLPELDVEPINTLTQVPGLVTFIFARQDSKKLPKSFACDSTTVLTISAVDSFNRTVSSVSNLHDLCDLYVHYASPAKGE